MILFLCFWVMGFVNQYTFESNFGEDFHPVAELQNSNFKNEGVKRKNHKVATKITKNTKSWQGHFSAQNFSNQSETELLNKIKRTIDLTISALPTKHTEELKSLMVLNQKHVSRGMANANKIIINTGTIENQRELMAVLVHEIGHNVDLGLLKGMASKFSEFKDGNDKISIDDKSLGFYKISWQNEETKKTDSERRDFVSGYAMSDPFEDFAESYLFYRLHGEKFRAANIHSKILKKKYDFMKNEIFAGQEFQKNKTENYDPFLHSAIFDATLLDFSTADAVAKN